MISWRLCRVNGLQHLRRMASDVQRAGQHLNSVHNIGAGPGAKDMDLAAWSNLKNSEVGAAVSSRLTELGVWRPNPQPKLRAEHLPGLTPGVPAVVVHGVLSEEECQELIAAFPEGGKGYMPGQRVAELYRDRKVKSRSLVDDALLARVLQERLQDYLPQNLDGGRLFCVNPHFRFVHYDTGRRHSTHIDGREPVAPRWVKAQKGWVQSRLTMQIYLNSHGKDFHGGTAAHLFVGMCSDIIMGLIMIMMLGFVMWVPAGEFTIVDADENTEDVRVKHSIEPQAGDVVLFYQERLNPPSEYPPYELQHQGNDVVDGEKFACRTMVDYIFPDESTAQMSNIKDDYMSRQSSQGRPRILAIGNTIMDTMLTVSHIPVDEKISVKSKKSYVGGQGANAAQALALLGSDVSFMTRLGDDAEGNTATKVYKSLGMDLRHSMVVPEAHTSVAAVLVATDKAHHRSCLIYDDPKLLRACTAEALESAFQRLNSGFFDAVYSDGWQMDLALPVLRAANMLSIPIVADVELVTDETRELAELANVLIASVSVIKALAEKNDVKAAVQALAVQGPAERVVVATEGEAGSYGAVRGQEVIHIPALDVNVQDTTGAGDSYHAGYLTAFLKGESLADCMSFATRVAAAKCETPGSSVTKEALERFNCQTSTADFCTV